jgi:hypothetical protein
MMTKSSRELWLHPFLFAFFPVATLLAGNLGEMDFSMIIRPTLASLLAALVVLLIARLVLRDTRKAAVLTTFYMLMFYSYGHIYNLIKSDTILGFEYGRHRILLLVWGVVCILGSWLLLKRIHLTHTTTGIMNTVSVLLLILPIYQVTFFTIGRIRNSGVTSSGAKPLTLSLSPREQLPDIYYIILDRYARQDILKSELNFDNTGFIQELESRGFYVATCSRSNYPTTLPSMASSLNMEYLDELVGEVNWQTDLLPLQPFIIRNRVRTQLENLGYDSISLTAYQNLQWQDADLFFDPGTSSGPSMISGVITPFEAILLRSTFLRIILDIESRSAREFARDINYPYAEHVQQQLYILEKIPEFSFLSAPTFAYIHITLPHPPYVFSPEGDLLDIQTVDQGFARGQPDGSQPGGYVGQVQFINRKILDIIDNLLRNSKQTPIIILQGDHGIAGSDPDAILNAYLVPVAVLEQLYPTITAVNTFRIIFSNAFGGDYPLLPDASYIPGDEGREYELTNSTGYPCGMED